VTTPRRPTLPLHATADSIQEHLDLEHRDVAVELVRQPGQPDRLVALARREVRDCLAEELRRLDPDEIYGSALACVGRVARGRTPVKVPVLAGT